MAAFRAAVQSKAPAALRQPAAEQVPAERAAEVVELVSDTTTHSLKSKPST